MMMTSSQAQSAEPVASLSLSSPPSEARTSSPSVGTTPNGDVTRKELPKRRGRPSTASVPPRPPPPPPPEPAEVKEEPSEFTVPSTNPAAAQENASEGPNFNITSALELLGHASVSNSEPGDLELEPKERNTPHSKRKARIEQLGLETFQCQLCKKAITRQGQYANLVNHLSRHARLHASKKQYW
ncbi:hypothetical protein ANCCAN_29647 [Ancylostoma caninum]|uniref:Uncharacterized protein n=1 Tax=Ancylostoma caninum TaxID=29170 RepID=A0A368EY14_ANCCA|nr:hypothetical protein ANCCAN_29647 [Ancylostoma caninum]